MENKSVIKIVQMEPCHIDGIAQLEESIFSVPFKKKDIEELYLNTSWRFFAAIDEENVVGYISLYLIIDEKEIVNLGISRLLAIPNITIQELSAINELQKAVKAGKVISFLAGEVDDEAGRT